MKKFNLHQLILMTLLMLFLGSMTAFADGTEQEENKKQDNPIVKDLDDVNIDNILWLNSDSTQVFIILDHYDHIITQGQCSDVMVKFFLSISDPLLDIDNIRYFRLAYENPEIMEQRLALHNR